MAAVAKAKTLKLGPYTAGELEILREYLAKPKRHGALRVLAWELGRTYYSVRNKLHELRRPDFKPKLPRSRWAMPLTSYQEMAFRIHGMKP